MNVIFRADASLDIDTGHIMRCLTLADALRERGAICKFICRAHAGNLSELIRQRGHSIVLLPLPATPLVSGEIISAFKEDLGNEGYPVHSAWLGAGITQEADAAATLEIIGFLDPNGSVRVDWLIVDHYALSDCWERRLRPACRHLMVIDDLADRRHDCDLLLDQNLGRKETDYAALAPINATRLVGPNYTLLRPEFAQWRPYSLAGRAERGGLQHLLIAMGGVDKSNVTERIIDSIAANPLDSPVHITIVMGSTASWLTQEQRRVASMSHETVVLKVASNIAQLMAAANLAIGAAGSTAWERCAMGLASIQLILAENQREAALALEKFGAVWTVNNVN